MTERVRDLNSPITRFLIPGLTLALLILLIWYAGRSGLGALFTAYAARSNQFAATNEAVRFAPSNPEAHYLRATILETRDLSSAVAEHERTVRVRPDDYALWLSLARARELNGDSEGAIAAARQATLLAPYYAGPHYQLGNILLRSGRTREGFQELRLAGASDPALMPGIIDLAWQLSSGRTQFVEQAISPSTPDAYKELGQYFRAKQQVDAAIAMLTAAGDKGAAARQSYVAELIGKNQFKDAARLWAVGRGNGVSPGSMVDPGFEKESDLSEHGFGWRLGESETGFQLSLDTTNPKEGRTSLKIEFTGPSQPAAPIISELVLVEPGIRYQLSFAARAQEIVSGALPEVIVVEATTQTVLAQSGEISKTNEGWRDYTIEFDSKPTLEAIKIVVQRQACSSTPCPIFGRLWLDSFSLRKL